MTFVTEKTLLIDQINALLPQTQCGQCGYQGCHPYAEAIAKNRADINQCPPGGDQGIVELAELLGRSPKPLNNHFGIHKPASVAFIIEEDCIGCVKCIAACPVDAIVGAAKFMHTVIASECTGCELCIAPCPVDCIIMKVLPDNSSQNLIRNRRLHSKRRFDARCIRKTNEDAEKAQRAKNKKLALLQVGDHRL